MKLLLTSAGTGLSGDSMAMCPRVGTEFVSWPTASADDAALGIVDCAIFPHLDSPGLAWTRSRSYPKASGSS